jgi:hypothetical protein
VCGLIRRRTRPATAHNCAVPHADCTIN